MNAQTEPERWPPAGTKARLEWNMPPWRAAIGRGMAGRCPACGNAPIFAGYLTVVPVCAACRAPLGTMPSDDAPPYIAMLVILHFVGIVVVMIFAYDLAPGVYGYAALLLLLVAACAAALRIAKGATIAILLKLGLKRAVLG